MDAPDLSEQLREVHESSFGWALACCSWDRAEAEDVLQTSYLKVLDGRAHFAGRSAFRTWLFGVIRLTALERRRTLGARAAALLRWGEAAPAQPAADLHVDAELRERCAHLRAALAELPERQREVLHLVFYGDMPIREAAEIMGIAVGTARAHYERGKARLRKLLGDES